METKKTREINGDMTVPRKGKKQEDEIKETLREKLTEVSEKLIC